MAKITKKEENQSFNWCFLNYFHNSYEFSISFSDVGN